MEHSELKIGVGIAYYGGMHPKHSSCLKGLLDARIQVLEIHGCAYPEMARAEVAREALESGIDVVVIINHDMEFCVSDVKTIACLAVEKDAVVSCTVDREFSDFPAKPWLYPIEVNPIRVQGESWYPHKASDCAFCAIPISILKALAEHDDREYTNSAIISTQMSKDSRPFFSPWKKAAGTLFTPPIADGVYCSPDRAFMLRVQAIGKTIYRYEGLNVHPLSRGGYVLTVRNPPGEKARIKQTANNISCRYAVCVPSYGALDLEQQRALLELDKAGVCVIELNGCPYLDLARSELVSIALDELKCDGVFFLDHDIIFTPADVLKLIDEAEARQDVVAALYCMRKTAHALIGAPDVPIDSTITFFKNGSVIPALYSGLGFAAIPKVVFEKLEEHFERVQGFREWAVLPVFALDVNGNFYAGEDTSFCARVQGLTIKHIPAEPGQEGTPNGVDWELKREESPTGHRVWLDTRIRIFHKGSYCYGIEDHSIAVPRFEELEAACKATRAEAREFLRSAAELPIETRLKAIGLDENATEPHHGLESEGVSP